MWTPEPRSLKPLSTHLRHALAAGGINTCPKRNQIGRGGLTSCASQLRPLVVYKLRLREFHVEGTRATPVDLRGTYDLTLAWRYMLHVRKRAHGYLSADSSPTSLLHASSDGWPPWKACSVFNRETHRGTTTPCSWGIQTLRCASHLVDDNEWIQELVVDAHLQDAVNAASWTDQIATSLSKCTPKPSERVVGQDFHVLLHRVVPGDTRGVLRLRDRQDHLALR